MRDIIVTTPKTEMKNAVKEVEKCINEGGGYYFRRFFSLPKEVDIGSRIFYVENGYIRGFGVICDIKRGPYICSVTGLSWGVGFYIFMEAKSWKWIKPQQMKGFQGFRYFDDKYEVVGGWLDPKPKAGG